MNSILSIFKNKINFITLTLIITAALISCNPKMQETVQESVQESDPTLISTLPLIPTSQQTTQDLALPTPITFEESDENTLSIAISSDPDSLDPSKAGTFAAAQVLDLTGCSLIAIDKDGFPQPYIAKSWDISPDGLTYTFKLREDATFHNGEPITAADFDYAFRRALDPELASPVAGPNLGELISIEILDDYQLQIKLPAAHYPFLLALADSAFMQPIPASEIDRIGETAYGRSPTGCGPYKFKIWESGNRILLEKYPEFNWGPEKAWGNSAAWKFDQIEFKVIPENLDIALLLESGQIDLASIDYLTKISLSNDDKLSVISSPQKGINPFVALNTSRVPFNSRTFRQAISHSIDKAAIAQITTQGNAEIQFSPLSSSQIGFDASLEEKSLGLDLDEAAQLMKNSGYIKNNSGKWTIKEKEFSLEILTMPFDTWIQTANILQQQLETFGISTEVSILESDTAISNLLAGEYDLAIFGFNYIEADILWLMFHSSQIGAYNMGLVNDPDLDDFLDQTRSKTNSIDRQEAVVEAQAHIMKQSYIIPLYTPMNFTAINNRIKNIQISNIQGIDLSGAYLIK
ncbi:MAG: ABC transporter substrate-binding protein [Anaerolineaceae bacterium]|nr:ABC transporter substrate-binding protein [Anaerolineaceae bacterium]